MSVVAGSYAKCVTAVHDDAGGTVAANDMPAQSRFSEAIGAAVHRAAVAAAPHLQQAHDDRVTAFLEGLEARVAPLLAPLLADVLAHPDTPPEVRAVLEVVADPTHKFDSSLIGIGLAALLYPFIQSAVLPFVTRIGQGAWDGDPTLLNSPAELALAVIKNNQTLASATHDARLQGLNDVRFATMVDNTGEPPALGELLLAYRRGEIDLARLEHGVRQSRVRDEWFDVITALRYQPPTPGEVLAGAVQGHLSIADATNKVAQAGIDPANFGWMYDTHGRPPGIMQMAELWNRGEISQAEFDQAVRESDVKDKYIPALEQLRFYVPPVRSIVAMLRAGAITDAQATALFHENGVRDADIAGYLGEAHHTSASKAKELTESQIVRMYSARFIDRANATFRLEGLKLDAGTVTLLLDFADEQARERYVNAVVTRVHARYVAYKLTDTEAVNALNTDGVPAAAVTQYMAVWKIERGANVRVMTPAAVVGAYRRKIITAADTKARLLSLGVQQADLAIVVADGWPPTKVDPAAVLAVVNA